MINIATEQAFVIIMDHLTRKLPFCLTRFGDGEAMFLKGDKDQVDFVMKRQLGFVPDYKDLQLITKNLMDTYHLSDMIGVSTQRHIEKKDFWAEVITIINETGIYASVDHYCSIDIHYDFLKGGYYDMMLRDTDELYYISCRNLDQELKDHFNIKEVHSFIIPPEMAFESSYEGDRHYPDAFLKASDWIRQHGNEGKLLLVGGGIVGKAYCAKWAMEGGVAVDIGSIFDEFAGRVTRGQGRGVDVYDETRKI